ncbi:hypothetical protein Pelo_6436 [Pelomyxa schiedti]|nr:hypothetical protein Pelo_6436 [Pelomyxa schiedti]
MDSWHSLRLPPASNSITQVPIRASERERELSNRRSPGGIAGCGVFPLPSTAAVAACGAAEATATDLDPVVASAMDNFRWNMEASWSGVGIGIYFRSYSVSDCHGDAYESQNSDGKNYRTGYGFGAVSLATNATSHGKDYADEPSTPASKKARAPYPPMVSTTTTTTTTTTPTTPIPYEHNHDNYIHPLSQHHQDRHRDDHRQKYKHHHKGRHHSSNNKSCETHSHKHDRKHHHTSEKELDFIQVLPRKRAEEFLPLGSSSTTLTITSDLGASMSVAGMDIAGVHELEFSAKSSVGMRMGAVSSSAHTETRPQYCDDKGVFNNEKNRPSAEQPQNPAEVLYIGDNEDDQNNMCSSSPSSVHLQEITQRSHEEISPRDEDIYGREKILISREQNITLSQSPEERLEAPSPEQELQSFIQEQIQPTGVKVALPTVCQTPSSIERLEKTPKELRQSQEQHSKVTSTPEPTGLPEVNGADNHQAEPSKMAQDTEIYCIEVGGPIEEPQAPKIIDFKSAFSVLMNLSEQQKDLLARSEELRMKEKEFSDQKMVEMEQKIRDLTDSQRKKQKNSDQGILIRIRVGPGPEDFQLLRLFESDCGGTIVEIPSTPPDASSSPPSSVKLKFPKGGKKARGAKRVTWETNCDKWLKSAVKIANDPESDGTEQVPRHVIDIRNGKDHKIQLQNGDHCTRGLIDHCISRVVPTRDANPIPYADVAVEDESGKGLSTPYQILVYWTVLLAWRKSKGLGPFIGMVLWKPCHQCKDITGNATEYEFYCTEPTVAFYYVSENGITQSNAMSSEKAYQWLIYFIRDFQKIDKNPAEAPAFSRYFPIPTPVPTPVSAAVPTPVSTPIRTPHLSTQSPSATENK